jgi:hypothetical protein
MIADLDALLSSNKVSRFSRADIDGPGNSVRCIDTVEVVTSRCSMNAVSSNTSILKSHENLKNKMQEVFQRFIKVTN